MNDPTKRELREQKRLVKRAGVKRRRKDEKRALSLNPDESAFTEGDFGRYSTVSLNGIDRDATRKPLRRGRPER